MHKTYKTIKTVEEEIDIETGNTVNTMLLHNNTKLREILRSFGFTFDKNGNNTYYSKALALLKKGKPMYKVLQSVLTESENGGTK